MCIVFCNYMATESGDFSEGNLKKNNHECGRGHLLNKGVWISFDRPIDLMCLARSKVCPCEFTPFMPFVYMLYYVM